MKRKKVERTRKAKECGKRLAVIILAAAMLMGNSTVIAMAEIKIPQEVYALEENSIEENGTTGMESKVAKETEVPAEPETSTGQELSMDSEVSTESELKGEAEKLNKQALLPSDVTETELTDYAFEAAKPVEITSIEITKEPTQNHTIYGFQKDPDYSGLVVKITYSDGSEGNLAYGSTDKLGYSIQANLVYEEEDLDEAGHLKKGEYQVLVTVGTAEASYQTTVVDLPKDAIKELTEDVETSTVLENYLDSQYFKFTPSEDGNYIACFNTRLDRCLYDSDLNYVKSDVSWDNTFILDNLNESPNPPAMLGRIE